MSSHFIKHAAQDFEESFCHGRVGLGDCHSGLVHLPPDLINETAYLEVRVLDWRLYESAHGLRSWYSRGSL